MITTPFYDPTRSYNHNYAEGPFGDLADGVKISRVGAPGDTFLGQAVYSRFGIPAGPLVNGAYVKAALDKGFDLPVYKTVRSAEHGCHPLPNIVPVDIQGDLTLKLADRGLVTKDGYSDPLSITNSFGVPSFDPDVWQPDLADAVAYAEPGQMVGASFQGTKWPGADLDDYIADWVSVARLAAETRAAFLEANLSCPNEGTTALLCFDTPRVAIISRQIKEAIGDIPLFLKISYFKDPDALRGLVKAVGAVVDGFSTINTISAEVRTKDGQQALPGDGRLRSGVCGHAIKWAGLDMVSRFAALREEFGMHYQIIGVGGITCAADYDEYLQAGADAAMSATGAMWNPQLAQAVYRRS